MPQTRTRKPYITPVCLWRSLKSMSKEKVKSMYPKCHPNEINRSFYKKIVEYVRAHSK